MEVGSAFLMSSQEGLSQSSTPTWKRGLLTFWVSSAGMMDIINYQQERTWELSNDGSNCNLNLGNNTLLFNLWFRRTLSRILAISPSS